MKNPVRLLPPDLERLEKSKFFPGMPLEAGIPGLQELSAELRLQWKERKDVANLLQQTFDSVEDAYSGRYGSDGTGECFEDALCDLRTAHEMLTGEPIHEEVLCRGCNNPEAGCSYEGEESDVA